MSTDICPTCSQPKFKTKLQVDVTMKPKNVCNEFLKVELGNGKFLTVNNYNGLNYVHLRHYDYDGKYPTKRGVALCPIRARTLFDITRTVDSEAEVNWSSPPAEREYRLHLGYGTFVTVFEVRGYRYYDVRRFWKPEDSIDPVATKAGVCMNVEEFEKFKEYIPSVNSILPELFNIRNCDCWFLNEITDLNCARCFPFADTKNVS